MSDKVTEESFLRDVATHEMEVIKDEELYRHIRFRRPGTGCMGFDFLTWPGYLCYTGDMGTFVFSRIPDMFEFFRGSGNNFKDGKTLYINPGYWQEKIQSESVFGKGAEEWSDEKFKEVILRRFEEFFEESKPEPWDALDDADEDPEDAMADYSEDIARWEWRKNECLIEIESQIFDCDNLQIDGYQAANMFDEHGLQFDDLWDNTFTAFTFYYLWCCYALAWGIKKYDELKDAEVP